jgi:hypothetical protein
MKIRRIFAGLIVALLLSVPPLAAACDVSCAFASMNSDCHSQQIETQDSGSDGMNMDGMAMPKMNHGQGQQAGAVISRAKANHPSIGEMGICEKRPCDGDSAVSTRANRSAGSRNNFVLARIEVPRADSAPQLSHGARDDIATHHVRGTCSLVRTLRI